MSVLEQIAFFQGRRDEVPNQELARSLVETRDLQGIEEIVHNLWNRDKNIHSDCLKVLYEIGYLNPALIEPYWQDFLKLLSSKNNRMVWGGMIALATIAARKADELFPALDQIRACMERGSVITRENGIKVLAGIAAQKDEYRAVIFPTFIAELESCEPKRVPQFAEFVLPAVDLTNQAAFGAVLQSRMAALSPAQSARVRKVLKSLS